MVAGVKRWTGLQLISAPAPSLQRMVYAGVLARRGIDPGQGKGDAQHTDHRDQNEDQFEQAEFHVSAPAETCSFYV